MPSIASITAITGLVSLVAASPIANLPKRAAGFRINQVRSGTVVKNGAVAYKAALEKYNKPVPAHIAKAAAGATTGSVEADPQQYDEAYLCPVDVGGTTLNLDFDTGSSDLWVFSSELPQSAQSGHSIYEVDPSKKLQGETWKIGYGDGSGASGDVYADTVVVGGVTATSQAVEAATSISTQFSQDTDNDGLLGLAFSSINTVKPDQQTTFFDTVKDDLAEALFAADLRAGQPGSYDFGYIDSSKYTGDIDYADVDNSQGFWMFTADGYAVGDQESSSSTQGIADTGTSLLLTDDDIVSAYYAQVDGAYNDDSQGGYVFDCNADLPDFSLIINGNYHTVPGSYINYAPTTAGSSTCFGGIQSDAQIGFGIFGDIFLKSQYVVFDVSQGSPRVGFGQQSGTAASSPSSSNSTSHGNSTLTLARRSQELKKMAQLRY